jgi:hypothetical protein
VDTILHVDWAGNPGQEAASEQVVALLRASDDLVEQVPGLLPHQYLAREADDLEPRLSGA